MTAGQDGAEWGCVLEGLHIRRMAHAGHVDFELAIPQPVEITAGPGHPSLLPVMGRSGAGKSTLMNVLSATSFPHPQEAKVTWRFPDGAVFTWQGGGRSSHPLEEIRSRYFGYAFQTASLLSHLTVEENLVLGRVNRGEDRAAAKDRAIELMLPAFGRNEKEVHRLLALFPTQLSGGEKQRVALLNAVVRDPYVLFADEPTGSLDRNTRGEVMRLLREWLDDKPDERFLIWVTHHDRDPADNFADRRLWVSDGTAVFERSKDGENWVPETYPEATEADDLLVAVP